MFKLHVKGEIRASRNKRKANRKKHHSDRKAGWKMLSGKEDRLKDQRKMSHRDPIDILLVIVGIAITIWLFLKN